MIADTFNKSPGPKKEDINLNYLLETFDAHAWATEFMDLFGGKRRDEIDKDLMISWFACAMMTGHDTGLKNGYRHGYQYGFNDGYNESQIQNMIHDIFDFCASYTDEDIKKTADCGEIMNTGGADCGEIGVRNYNI